MKFLATSDLHGNLPKVETPFDLLMICGDVCPTHDQYYAFQFEWLKNDFVNWIKSLPFKTPFSKVVMTWGNHDFAGERMSRAEMRQLEIETGDRLKILRHDVYEFEFPVSDGIDSLKIFGTPYCSLFGTWAFMVSDETLEKKFGQIPEDTNIIISHDSPNIYDLGSILEGRHRDRTTGNRILANHIERVKPLIFHSGHFHSGNHMFEEHNGTMLANVSFVNEEYEPFYPFLEYEYDEETRTIKH